MDFIVILALFTLYALVALGFGSLLGRVLKGRQPVEEPESEFWLEEDLVWLWRAP